ncbi:MAG: zeta toxin family protein [Alphaproteobacteria bacterium]|nr:zeta toxin family protein [Alphaproteobacteria bacterium]
MPTKWMWIVAGPNGAGKSSFAGDFLADLGHRNLVKLNADERTLELRKTFPDAPQDELNLKAAIEIDAEVAACIKSRVSFVVETVLSSAKYQDDLLAAKENGFNFGFVYVSLHPPELSPRRVSERVKKGGHAVDHDTAVKRHRKSHEQFSWFAPHADILMVFDNSVKDGDPVLVASRANGKALKYLRRGRNPSVDAALDTAFPPKPTISPPRLDRG